VTMMNVQVNVTKTTTTGATHGRPGSGLCNY
jgi:hypothetical protein